MRKLVSCLLTSGLFIILVTGNIGGCGDIGPNCSFDLPMFFNGMTMEQQSSEWDCKRGGETVFTLGLFGDFTGIRSDIGEFDFERTACRQIEFNNPEGTGKYRNLEGSILSQGDVTVGTLLLDQRSDDFGDFSFVCDLVEFN